MPLLRVDVPCAPSATPDAAVIETDTGAPLTPQPTIALREIRTGTGMWQALIAYDSVFPEGALIVTDAETPVGYKSLNHSEHVDPTALTDQLVAGAVPGLVARLQARPAIRRAPLVDGRLDLVPGDALLAAAAPTWELWLGEPVGARTVVLEFTQPMRSPTRVTGNLLEDIGNPVVPARALISVPLAAATTAALTGRNLSYRLLLDPDGPNRRTLDHGPVQLAV